MTEKSNYFDSRLKFDKRRDYIWKSIARDLQKHIDANSVLLDLGAGYCDFVNNISASEKWATDLFPDLQDYANKNINVRTGSIFDKKIDIPDDYFDYIFASNFLEHFSQEEIPTIFEFIRSKLKKHGKLILIQPNYKYAYREYFDDYTHKTVFTDTNIVDYLSSNGFTIEMLKPKYLPFSMKSKLSFGYKLIKLYLRLPIRPFAKQMLVVSAKK
jgi:cyclopropane fatty-acyl-phospholipid synthase-like methyltransferase